jgi:hypothetical protein
MTAGASDLQSKVFQGLGNLSFPGNLGQSFSSTGAYQPPQMNMGAYNTQPIGTGPMQATQPLGDGARAPGSMLDMMRGGNFISGPSNGGVFDPYEGGISPGAADTTNYGSAPTMNSMLPQGGIAGLPQQPQQPQQPQGIASQYMNPYLQAVLDPQMAELRRQNDITNMQANAKLTGAGAYGGGRQAIMNAENNRNLMQEMNKTVGQGYASAYDKGMGQFNIEQGQAKDLVNMLANAGGQQRGIEQEGITADYNEFLAQRDDPMKKTQYLQSMLQGIPYQTITNSPLPKSGMGQLTEIVGSLPGLEENLKNLGIIPK